MADITLPSSLLQPRDDNDADSILSILGRIHDERGHFRHITEQSLQAEIAINENDEESSETDDEDDGAEVDATEEKDRREQLWAARAEMRQHVECVHTKAIAGRKSVY
jgi:mediator of RNA polymerase II transcription subunit 17